MAIKGEWRKTQKRGEAKRKIGAAVKNRKEKEPGGKTWGRAEAITVLKGGEISPRKTKKKNRIKGRGGERRRGENRRESGRIKQEQNEKKNKRDGERRLKWQKFIRHKIFTSISY